MYDYRFLAINIFVVYVIIYQYPIINAELSNICG